MLDSDNSPVGYGRPPKESQFKPGQSGNPRGRPRKTRNTSKRLHELLDERVSMQVNGEKCSVSTRDAVLLRLISNALGGDHRALVQILRMANEHKEPEPLEVDDGDREALNTQIRGFIDSLDAQNEEMNDEY